MRSRLLFTPLLLLSSIFVFAQEPIPIDKKVYTNEDGKIFINRTLPVYLRIATDSAASAESYLLNSQESAEYSNPMYFDTEGMNTVRSPWAVDPKTKRMVYPQQDIIFEVYADSKAPVSYLKANSTKYHKRDDTVFYGGGYTIEITASDQVSGVEHIYYSLNGAAYKPYADQLTFPDEKNYTLKYYAVDFVGNMENVKTKSFSIDKSPPVTDYEIKGLMKDNIVSPDARIELKSKDNISGVKRIYYSLNNGPEIPYTSPISVRKFAEGGTNMYFYAVDNLNNKEDKKSIGNELETAAAENDSEKKNVVFSFYIDNEPPEVDFSIEGAQSDEKYVFVSGDSKLAISAKDDKSGVDKIYYSINSTSLDNEYKEPIQLEKSGLQYFHYAAADFVGNRSPIANKAVFLDDAQPTSKISVQGPKYTRRDTLFVSAETKISLSGTDGQSGLQDIVYSINGAEEKPFNQAFHLEKEGVNEIAYKAKDKVQNLEDVKHKTIILDKTPPTIHYHFSVEPIGKKIVREEEYVIYPANTILYLASTDKASGGEKLEYTINGSKIQTEIPLTGFDPDNYLVEVTAYDVLENKSAASIIKFSIEN